MAVLFFELKEWSINIFGSLRSAMSFKGTGTIGTFSDEDVSVTVGMHYEVDYILDLFGSYLLLAKDEETAEKEYIERHKDALLNNHIQGVVSFHAAEDGEKEHMEILLLISKEAWDEIRGRAAIPLPTSMLSITVPDNYLQILHSREFCGLINPSLRLHYKN